MAGYSTTPLATKLGIKKGHDVVFLRAPGDFRDALGELPDGVRMKSRATGQLDVIVHRRNVVGIAPGQAPEGPLDDM